MSRYDRHLLFFVNSLSPWALEIHLRCPCNYQLILGIAAEIRAGYISDSAAAVEVQFQVHQQLTSDSPLRLVLWTTLMKFGIGLSGLWDPKISIENESDSGTQNIELFVCLPLALCPRAFSSSWQCIIRYMNIAVLALDRLPTGSLLVTIVSLTGNRWLLPRPQVAKLHYISNLIWPHRVISPHSGCTLFSCICLPS